MRDQLASKIQIALENERKALELAAAAADDQNETIQSVHDSQNLGEASVSSKKLDGKRGSTEVPQASLVMS